MMWHPGLLILPLLLASCGGDRPKIVAAPLSQQEQACAVQADDDPVLRQARGIAAGQLDREWQHGPQLQQIKRDAITRCCKARGLVARGGVERPR